MHYGRHKIETMIDWVELEIQMAERSNFWTVQGYLREALQLPEDSRPGVDPMDATDTGSASIFRFRVQDPKTAHQLEKVLTSLRERFNIEIVRVVGIEVAFDTYLRGASKKDLAQIVADRYRFLTAKPSQVWHLYRRKGEKPIKVSKVERLFDLVKYLQDEWQIADSEDKGRPEIRYHGYVKAWDNGQPLENEEEWRARWEVTLRGRNLPCKTLQELAQFQFVKLAAHFKFRRLADDVHPGVRHALMTWSASQLGMKGKYRRANKSMVGRLYSGTREYRRATMGDEMNESIRDCLNKLTRHWRGNPSDADFQAANRPQTRASTGSQ
jgi:hypothetical protein